jgi:hypothetical protein
MIKYFLNFFRFSFFVLPVLFVSCGTSKKTTTGRAPTASAEMTFQQAMDSMRLNMPSFSALTGKGDIEFNSSGNSVSFSFHMRMKRDSAIWLSVSPLLGIEAVRILFTRDSVKALDRLNNIYYSDGYNAISMLANANLNFSLLQSLIMAGYFPTSDTLRSLYVESPDYLLSTVEKKKNSRTEEEASALPFTWDVWVSPADNRIHKMNIAQPSDKKNVVVNYSDFRDTGAGIIPFRQDINLTDGVKQKTAQVIISFSKINPVADVEFPFSIPSKFEHKRLAKSP